MRTFLITIAVLFGLSAMATASLEPGEPIGAYDSVFGIILSVLIKCGLMGWALHLLDKGDFK